MKMNREQKDNSVTLKGSTKASKENGARKRSAASVTRRSPSMKSELREDKVITAGEKSVKSLQGAKHRQIKTPAGTKTVKEAGVQRKQTEAGQDMTALHWRYIRTQCVWSRHEGLGGKQKHKAPPLLQDECFRAVVRNCQRCIGLAHNAIKDSKKSDERSKTSHWQTFHPAASNNYMTPVEKGQNEKRWAVNYTTDIWKQRLSKSQKEMIHSLLFDF